jgi:hypothetical protein
MSATNNKNKRERKIIKTEKKFLLFTTAYKVNANGICGFWRLTLK